MTAHIADSEPEPERGVPAVADAEPGNWVDRLAPKAVRPYLRLARMDRPIGTWLLLFPCWWSLTLAEVSVGHPYPDPWSLLLFAVGAIVMRGAGCAYNDYVDREYDARVEAHGEPPHSLGLGIAGSGAGVCRRSLARAASSCCSGSTCSRSCSASPRSPSSPFIRS